MRTMLLAHIPCGPGNRAIEDGSIGPALEKLAATLQPEAAYFFPRNGQRAFLMVFDTDDPSTAVAGMEPLWLSLEAEVELIPVLGAADLKRGLARL